MRHVFVRREKLDSALGAFGGRMQRSAIRGDVPGFRCAPSGLGYSRDDRGAVVAARTYLTSETGKVYTMLAHAAGRFE